MRRKSSNRGSGLWPTPDANAVNVGEKPETWLARREILKAKGINGNGAGMPLRIAAQLSTQTSEPSTEPLTGEQPYLPAGFHASHFPKPGSEEARQMTVRSGLKCSGLYAKPGPLGSLVRTLLESSRWNSTTCFLTWKVKATPSNRLLFQLAPLTPDIAGTESGLLPTPMSAPESEASHNQVSGQWRKAMAKHLWPTPTEQDSANDGGPSQYERNSLPLNAEIKLWATPNVPNGGRVNSEEEILNKGTTERGKRQVSLESQVKMWPTVSANNQAGGTTGLNGGSGARAKLHAMVGREEGLKMSGGSLNPTWVEWLMGYPLGWTALKGWATRLSRKSHMKS